MVTVWVMVWVTVMVMVWVTVWDTVWVMVWVWDRTKMKKTKNKSKLIGDRAERYIVDRLKKGLSPTQTIKRNLQYNSASAQTLSDILVYNQGEQYPIVIIESKSGKTHKWRDGLEKLRHVPSQYEGYKVCVTKVNKKGSNEIAVHMEFDEFIRLVRRLINEQSQD